LGHGFAFLYKKYGFVKCVIGLVVAVGVVSVVHNIQPSKDAPHIYLTKDGHSLNDYMTKGVDAVRADKPACGPEVGPYDYHGDCRYTENSVRQAMRVGATQCPVLIADAMGVDADSLKAGKVDYSTGKPLYSFTRSGDGYRMEYVCADNMGDVMVMWSTHYPGEKPCYSKWHNLNAEAF
jgi:hypothetical protein